MKISTFRVSERLKEIDMFFAGRSSVHKALRRIVKKLEKAHIPYAVMGGIAVNIHRYERTTGDVDLLMTQEGLEEFRRRFVPKYYTFVARRPRRLKDRQSGVTVDVLVTGCFPGSGKPGPIAFPDPTDVAETIEDIRVINLKTLVQLKLAARRYRDFGDVVELIRFNHLDESFAQRLHPSVRGDFIECSEEKRREDEYEAREG
jgi:hypothetical protein